jgi:S-adenosylmethionine:tRNA ribosyltransferase-isomerase
MTMLNQTNFDHLSAFDFDLPPELIAQAPAIERTASRLLDLSGNAITDKHFHDIDGLLQPGDLLVFNDTKVIKARLYGVKSTGGKIEALIERITGEHTALAQIKASKTPQPGSVLSFHHVDGTKAELARVGVRHGEFFELQFESPILIVLDWIGVLPLPPYVEHQPTAADEERYQTVYAKEPGAVAAPTAGLHFDDALLNRLRAKGIRTAFVTLHVGAGTFQPVRSDKVSEHLMHSEWYRIPAETATLIVDSKAKGHRVIAVGTTSSRTLEGAFKKYGVIKAVEDETNIFITPGYQFKVVDALITNFHLPKSTLMMLVTAFGGYERLMNAYRHAIKNQYRFFSFGDAMFITKQ